MTTTLARPLSIVLIAAGFHRGAEEATYYTVRPDVRVQYAALYLGLACFLAIMSNNVHEELARVSP